MKYLILSVLERGDQLLKYLLSVSRSIAGRGPSHDAMFHRVLDLGVQEAVKQRDEETLKIIFIKYLFLRGDVHLEEPKKCLLFTIFAF